MTLPKIDIILLAAGKSERMGAANKLLLPVQGKPLLIHALETLQQIEVRKKLVITGFEASSINSLIPADQFQTIYNPDFEKGMTSSIQAGISALDSQSIGAMIIPADLPGLNADTLNKLIHLFLQKIAETPKAIVAAADKGIQKNPVIFSAYHYPAIRSHTNPNGCKKIIESNSTYLTMCNVADLIFFEDIDTPADYQRITA